MECDVGLPVGNVAMCKHTSTRCKVWGPAGRQTRTVNRGRGKDPKGWENLMGDGTQGGRP